MFDNCFRWNLPIILLSSITTKCWRRFLNVFPLRRQTTKYELDRIYEGSRTNHHLSQLHKLGMRSCKGKRLPPLISDRAIPFQIARRFGRCWRYIIRLWFSTVFILFTFIFHCFIKNSCGNVTINVWNKLKEVGYLLQQIFYRHRRLVHLKHPVTYIPFRRRLAPNIELMLLFSHSLCKV